MAWPAVTRWSVDIQSFEGGRFYPIAETDGLAQDLLESRRIPNLQKTITERS